MMKNKVIQYLICFICAFFIYLCDNNTCFASDQLSVNGISVSKGDIVNYSFYMSDVNDKVEALGAFIYYDSDYLEYIDDSIGFDVLNNAMTNITEEQIYYSAIDVVDGFDFKKEGLVVTVSFKVLDTASGSEMIINHFDEIFTFVNEDVDLTPNDYHSREVITVNGEVYQKNSNNGINASDVKESSDQVSVQSSAAVLKQNSNKPLFYTIGAVILIFLNAFGAAVLLRRKKGSKKV